MGAQSVCITCCHGGIIADAVSYAGLDPAGDTWWQRLDKIFAQTSVVWWWSSVGWNSSSATMYLLTRV